MSRPATPVRTSASLPRRAPLRRPGNAPKLVRHIPLAQRILSAPQDWWMSIEETFNAIDWDAVQLHASPPITVASNILMVLAKLRYLSEQSAEEDPIVTGARKNQYRHERWDVEEEWSLFADTSLLMAMVEWFLIFLSFTNAYRLFTRCKAYQMIHFLDELYETRPRLSPNMRTVRLDETLLSQKPISIWRRLWLHGKNAVWPQANAESSNGKLIVELRAWDPPVLGLNFFCWFSPPQALLMHFVESDNWVPLMGVALMVGFSLHYLATTFQDLLRDQQIIYGQTHKEYNLSLVSRRIFNNCIQKGTQTDPLAEFDYEEERTEPESQDSHGLFPKTTQDGGDRMMDTSWTSVCSRQSPLLYFDDAAQGSKTGDVAAQSSRLDDQFSTLRPRRQNPPIRENTSKFAMSSPPASSGPTEQTPGRHGCTIGHCPSFGSPGPGSLDPESSVSSSPFVPGVTTSTPRAPTSAARASLPPAAPSPDSWRPLVLR